MSFTDTRVLLATCLDSVTGVTGHTYRPAVVLAGTAWPRRVSVERGPGDSWQATWEVLLILSGDERTAMTFADDVFPELVEEIESTGTAYVQRADDIEYSIGASKMFAISVICTSE